MHLASPLLLIVLALLISSPSRVSSQDYNDDDDLSGDIDERVMAMIEGTWALDEYFLRRSGNLSGNGNSCIDGAEEKPSTLISNYVSGAGCGGVTKNKVTLRRNLHHHHYRNPAKIVYKLQRPI